MPALVACGGSSGGKHRAIPPDGTVPAPAAVDVLAADAMKGRDNQTPESTNAQDYLIGQLRRFARPLGRDYRHPFSQGTNLLAVIPGSELRDQYVVLGAHYDHLGSHCRDSGPADSICNGATDNAAGVAAALEIGRRLAAGPKLKRSIVLAFWDAEEDGLLGSRAYVTDPAVPLDATTAYVNWDIQGSDLLPSLKNTTFVVGAETGGPALVDAARAATKGSRLDAVLLSLVFGQGRSDHAVFASAGVPVVFFSDSTSSCYHTVHDDLTALDRSKLQRQIDLGEALVRDLASTTTPPTFVKDTPVASYDDAVALLDVLRRAQPDLSKLPADAQQTGASVTADVQAIVDAGRAGFDDAAMGRLLRDATTSVDTLALTPCRPAH